MDQHLPFEKEGREYLDKNCFLDCSKLTPKEYEMIADAVKNKPESVLGTVSEADWVRIKESIINSPTIKGKYKKKFGLNLII